MSASSVLTQISLQDESVSESECEQCLLHIDETRFSLNKVFYLPILIH